MPISVRSETADVLEIDLYEAIGSWWGITAKSVRERIKNSTAKTIKLRVNSPGGDVIEGFAIYNLLNEHPARVEVDIDGYAASIASVIICAADEIRIAKNAYVMIHNPWACVCGESDDLRKWAEIMDKMRESGIAIYSARTGQTREKLIELMDAETWMTADEARALGFVDTVKPAKAPPKSAARAQAQMLMALSDRDFQNMPAELRARVEAARAQQQPNEQPTDQRGAPSAEQEQDNMKPQILAALGINEESQAEARIAQLVKLEKVTGKTGDEAVTVVEAALTELPVVRAERDTAKLEQLITQAKAADKLTPAEEKALRDSVKAGDITLKGVEAQLSARGAHPLLGSGKNEIKPPANPTGSGSSTAELTHNGKTWAQMKPIEKHNLHEENLAHYEAMRDAAAKQ